MKNKLPRSKLRGILASSKSFFSAPHPRLAGYSAAQNNFILWFNEVGKEDIAQVGGKGANLGEMTQFRIPVPLGFIVTAQAYFHFLESTKLKPKIARQLKNLDVNNPPILRKASENIKNLILGEKMPEEIADQIIKAYFKLSSEPKTPGSKIKKLIKTLKEDLSLVAVRSSATAEDLPEASFAGQQATFLNVLGESNVVEAVKKSWASLFEARAIFYRQNQNFDHFKLGIAVPVQKMVQSDQSGIMFTLDPVENDKNKIVIEAVLGLGELIVQGAVTPDHYEVDKQTLKIINKQIGRQDRKLVKVGRENKEIKLEPKTSKIQKISDEAIISLAALGKLIEKHYYHPQDIEWAIENKEIFIVQTRPVTTLKKKEGVASPEFKINLPILLEGAPASPGLRSGLVKILKSAAEIGKIKVGDILVASQTNPDYVPAMKKAAAIVTDKGGRTSHAAIVSRELGIPAVVGTGTATKVLKNGEVVTVDGRAGKIYKGAFKAPKNYLVARLTQSPAPAFTKLKTATKVYVNLAEPEKAAGVANSDVDGIGLLRAEFILAEIGEHPKKIIAEHREKEYIQRLSENLKIFAENFTPRPVIYRTTDFKTNEYRNLKGGRQYEPEEPNPMLGFRGVSRYLKDPRVFKMEIEAVKLVRHKHGLKNLHLMLPFVRTVKELIEVKSLISGFGLHRGPSFKLYMMAEIPSNVILLEKFIEAGLDGISIGSNDLTMLLLGTDRDNSEVAFEFDERNEAVLWALEKIIKTCHQYGVTSSICGQAPSDYPDLVEKLVGWGITAISVNPDAANNVRNTVYEAEKKLCLKSNRFTPEKS